MTFALQPLAAAAVQPGQVTGVRVADRLITMDALPADLTGKVVGVRVDFNCPFRVSPESAPGARDDRVEITSDTRIRASLDTIREILNKGGVPVILCHYGDPKDPDFNNRLSNGQRIRSTRPLAEQLVKLLAEGGTNVRLHFVEGIPNAEGIKAAIAKAIDGAHIVFAENVRFNSAEMSKNAAERGALSQSLAKCFDYFVNDAWGAFHRDHASVAISREMAPSCAVAGRLVVQEVQMIEGVLHSPERPKVILMGGQKMRDKARILERLIEGADAQTTILLSGGVGHAVNAARRHGDDAEFREVSLDGAGSWWCKDPFNPTDQERAARVDALKTARGLDQLAREKGVALMTPKDHVVAGKIDAPANASNVVPDGNVMQTQIAGSVGPQTQAEYLRVIGAARVIIWNGPLGAFEFPAFGGVTQAVGDFVAQLGDGSVALIGGGETGKAYKEAKARRKSAGGKPSRNALESTAGGAMLDFLEKGPDMPGFKGLLRS